MQRLPSKAVMEKFARVKLFLCDVDGVLTDASVFIGEKIELKRYNILDGLGMKFLQKEGIKVGWISNRPSTATLTRAEELKIDFLHQRKGGNKVESALQILAETGLEWEDICYVGDDVVDISVIKRAGIGVAVANAVPEAKAVAGYVTQAAGGHGAVRECVELILKSQQKWDKVVAEHSA
jgi:3-deoxy-D-manno-octulosonate 8-phosphate phosphatase (KDO 8-P phosphatase)